MSKTKSTDELHSHKKQALQNVEDYLNKLIASEDSHDNGKADKLCYWLKDWMTFLDFESISLPYLSINASLFSYFRYKSSVGII